MVYSYRSAARLCFSSLGLLSVQIRMRHRTRAILTSNATWCHGRDRDITKSKHIPCGACVTRQHPDTDETNAPLYRSGSPAEPNVISRSRLTCSCWVLLRIDADVTNSNYCEDCSRKPHFDAAR